LGMTWQASAQAFLDHMVQTSHAAQPDTLLCAQRYAGVGTPVACLKQGNVTE
jgi:hypothetical protein